MHGPSKLFVYRMDLHTRPPLPEVPAALLRQAASTTGTAAEPRAIGPAYQTVTNGPELWEELHRRALVTTGDDSRFLASFALRLPCGACRTHWMDLVTAHPPTFGGLYFHWTVQRHNDVNRKLGKPEVGYFSAWGIWQMPG